MAMSWALVKNRLARPTSRTSDLPPRTTGMIRAVQASLRASPGLMRSPVSRTPAFWSRPSQRVEVDRDHDRRVGAADLREVLRADAFDELGERPPHPLRTRAALDAGSFGGSHVLGGGEREEHLLQHRALQRREGELAVDLAVAVVGHREPAVLGGLRLFLREEVGLVLVGQVGATTSRSRRPRIRRALASWCCGFADQVLLGLDRPGRGPGRRAASFTARRITSRLLEHAGHHARARAGRGRGCRGRSRGARPGAQPAGSAWSVCASQFAVDVAPTSWPTWTSSACIGDPGLELDHLRLQPGQLHQRRRGLVSGHRPHRHVDHSVGDRAHPRGRRGHLVVGCGHRCHGSTQARTTDSQSPRSALIHRVSTVTNRSRSGVVDELRRLSWGRWFRGRRCAPYTSTTGYGDTRLPQPPAAATAGGVTVNAVPSPRREPTSSRPACRSTTVATMARPRPVPGSLRASGFSVR